ncbi:hypothetical protein [Nostoc sp. NMS7]|nr:hypothetical protein [Nostoc sp. NMS7]
MAAIVLSLVYRQIQHLTDVLGCLEVEGLLWVNSSPGLKPGVNRSH